VKSYPIDPAHPFVHETRRDLGDMKCAGQDSNRDQLLRRHRRNIAARCLVWLNEPPRLDQWALAMDVDAVPATVIARARPGVSESRGPRHPRRFGAKSMADGGPIEGCRLRAIGPDNVRGGDRLQRASGRERAVPCWSRLGLTATGLAAEYGVRPESSRSARAVRRAGRTRSRRAGSSRALATSGRPEASRPVRGEPWVWLARDLRARRD
jgi:hypothetical protein